jgi:hypothetical protein
MTYYIGFTLLGYIIGLFVAMKKEARMIELFHTLADDLAKMDVKLGNAHRREIGAKELGDIWFDDHKKERVKQIKELLSKV